LEEIITNLFILKSLIQFKFNIKLANFEKKTIYQKISLKFFK